MSLMMIKTLCFYTKVSNVNDMIQMIIGNISHSFIVHRIFFDPKASLEFGNINFLFLFLLTQLDYE